MAALQIDVEQVDGVFVVAISGPIDSATIEDWKTAIDKLAQHHHALIVLDFKKLTYMNSRAFGLLSAFYRSVLVNMGKLVICHQNKRIEKNMSLLGLNIQIHDFPTREEAIAALKA